MEEDKGRGRTRKRGEMEVKDKIEETKDKKGDKMEDLENKNNGDGSRDRTQLPR